jgi:hypothetical protein
MRNIVEKDHKNQHSEKRSVTNAARMCVELLSDTSKRAIRSVVGFDSHKGSGHPSLNYHTVEVGDARNEGGRQLHYI